MGRGRRKNSGQGVRQSESMIIPSTFDPMSMEHPVVTNKTRSIRKRLFVDNITRLLFSNFKWYGISNNEARVIENLLIREGRIAAVRTTLNVDTNTPNGILFGRYGNENGSVDFYGLPNSCTISGNNGQTYTVNSQDEFVLGFDTSAVYMSTVMIAPIVIYIEKLAEELEDAFAAWKVAVDTHKTGIVFTVASEREKKTLQKALQGIDENNPYIIIEAQSMTGVERPTVNNYNPQVIQQYHDNFMNVWSSVMDMLGLENSHFNKRAQQSPQEIEINMNLSRYIAADRLKARKDFCDEINEKFGLGIDVENYLSQVTIETMNESTQQGDSMEGSDNDLGE